MKGSWFRGLIAAVTVVLAGLLALSLWAGMPCASTLCECPYCGARADRIRVLLVPLPLSVNEGSLARYWRRHVDGAHQHTWIARATRSPGRIADHPGAFLSRWLIKDETAIAVLQSLHSRRARIALMDALWMPQMRGNRREYRAAGQRCMAIHIAYVENPRRKDWPKILKSMGLPH